MQLSVTSESVRNALDNMQQSTRSLLGLTIMVEFIIAIILLSSAAFIYLKKVKGNEKRTIWFFVALALGLIGLLFILGFILGLITYFATPIIVDKLLVG